MKKHFTYTKKKKILSSALALCALLLWSSASSVQAAEEMIDNTPIQLHGETMTVELWGNRHEGGYTNDLLLLLKNDDKIITAYNPSVQGGYNLMLQTVQIKPVKKTKGKADTDKPKPVQADAKVATVDLPKSNKASAPKNVEMPKQDEQVLLSVGQGDWRARTDYRIVDFDDRENIKELFSGIENMGLVQSAKLVDMEDGEGKAIDVALVDGEANQAPLADAWTEELGAQALSYGGLTSLTVYDIDEDGQQELFTNQTIEQRRHVLADVAAIWKLQPDEMKGQKQSDSEKAKVEDKNTQKKNTSVSNKDKKDASEKEELTIREQRKKARKEVREKLARPTWKQSAFTIMTASLVKDKTNTINDGMDIEDGAGVILSRRIVVPGGEASYPVYAGKDIELQKKINEGLEKARETYLERFYDNSSDMAFKVMRADDVVLSVQYISSTDKGFIHHNVNIDMETGDVLALEDVLDTKDADLLPVLNVLKTNDKLSFANGLPEEWYLEGSNLYFVQNVEDKDEAAGFALGNLHKFLRDAKWLKG